MTKRTFILLAAALLGLSCSELKNDLPAPVAPGLKVHDAAWSDTANPGFHGRQLLVAVPAWNDGNCQVCHAANFSGGTSGVTCFKCHDPYPHSVRFPVATGRHRGYLEAMGFPLPSCQKCHGRTYTGGNVVAISCEQAGCHVDASGNPKSPETCNTCHGTFSAPANLTGATLVLSAAPPRDVVGDTSATAPGVGAHQKHLVTGMTGKTVKCQECHTVPNRWDDPGHIPQVTMIAAAGHAPSAVSYVGVVVFNDTLANLVTGDGTLVPKPAFDPGTATCSNTYCHGNWLLKKSSAPAAAQTVFNDTATVMVGAKASPAWTAGSAEGQCYSCHGAAPNIYTPSGHIQYALSACSICHGDVVDASGNILNRTKHMNGVIDLVAGFGGPRPMQ
jgi:predicted CxxxxCH...CXXCH cytochrome family protein